MGSVGFLACLPVALHLLHLLAKREGAHVSPDFLDVVQALLLRAALADVVPAQGVLTVGRPDRVLLFVIHDHLVDRGVFFFVPTHRSLSFLRWFPAGRTW